MKMEVGEIFSEVIGYLSSAWIAVNPVLKWLLGIIMWVLFPNGELFQTYAMIIGITVALDIVTKYISISANNGGFMNACRTGKINSYSMWIGTRRKIVSYLLIMILVGLGYRFEMVEVPMEMLGTLAYAVMFLREGQSILENVYEAGYKDVGWFLVFVKRKKESIIEKHSGSSDEVNKS